MSHDTTTAMRAEPRLTPAERAALGKEARRRSSRSGHAGYEPSPGRPDPLAVLEAQSAARVPELVPIRYSRMTESPFRFYRGAAAIMASDLAGTPVSGITAQLCGDAHLLNFRLLASPERQLMFDINDFDETLRYEAGESARERAGYAEVAGIGLGLFTRKLTGRGRVCGVQFRPGGFRPFAPEHALSDLTGRQVDAAEVLRTPPPLGAVLDPADEDARVAALDACLLALEPRPDPQATLAMELADRVRTDRSVCRAGQLARDTGLTPRSLQRLFSAYVGVGPKWVILRYRIHEALERAESDPAVDWARLAADLGYSDQAHLVRDFTATVGVPPTAYAAPPP
ncbi:hypothetical protein SCYAM73S_06737 [Streptomyces cyaneofuscatus]